MNQHAVALGKLGGKAGTGKAKARTTDQAKAAAHARWGKASNMQNTNNPGASESEHQLGAVNGSAPAPAWSEALDDDGNPVWEAAGPYTDECGSPEFKWRVRQRLRDNRVEWVEDSDAELMMDEQDPRTWASLREAQAAMAQDHSDILEMCATKAQNAKLSDGGPLTHELKQDANPPFAALTV